MTDYTNHIIYSAVVGSTAYGLAVEGSDVDRRGIYLAPTRDFWSLTKPPEQIMPDKDTTYWEAEKFIKLALSGNPTVLEVLWVPENWYAEPHVYPLAVKMRRNRHIFIGQHLRKPYLGYARDQMHRYKTRMSRPGHREDWKFLMHCVRVMLQGIYALQTGQILLMPPQRDRDQLIEIRQGLWPFDEVLNWTTRLEVEFEGIGDHLPTGPDHAAANRLLAELREAAL